MLLENFTKFIRYYGKGKKTKLFCFGILSFLAGLLELLGVALIYPFILLIVSPQILVDTPYYLKFKAVCPIDNVTVLALVLGLIVLCVFVFKNLFMIGILNLQTKFTTKWRTDIAKSFMRFYMYAPYKSVMRISEAEKLYAMNTLSGQVVDGFVVRIISLLTNVIVISMIFAFLLIKFPIAAIVTIGFVAVCLSVQNKFFKAKTIELSEKLNTVQRNLNNVLMGNVNTLKELKIFSAEDMFFEKYLKSQGEYRKVLVDQLYFSSIPPYIVEIFIVISLLVLGAVISLQNLSNNSALIASFAVVVAALFRIAPALNRIQTSIININSNRELVKDLIGRFESWGLGTVRYEKPSQGKALDFMREISLKDVTFSYNEQPVLKNIFLNIQKGDFIGIIGLSGAGKTTLADVLMGLLPIDSGEVYLDSTKLTPKNFPNFRKLIGYVTQEVRVMDDSFRANVAWGIPEEEIDDERVCHVLRLAKLYDFVETFENGIYANPVVGTSGLSQGQKQRLAIARALYRNPQILVLDEATSSLDVVVENEITEVLNGMVGDLTVIAIAHRLSTLKSCNKLVYLKEGEIVDIGTFEELSERYEDFSNLVKLSSISEKN